MKSGWQHADNNTPGLAQALHVAQKYNMLQIALANSYPVCLVL